MGNINFLNMEETVAEKQILCSVFNRIKERYGKGTGEIIDRINYEIKYFKDKSQLKYLLFIADLFECARKSGVAVYARDAMNSSVLFYLYGVTEIDPLYFNLPFKFPTVFGKEKVSHPDIGFDIEKGSATLLENYLKKKYGVGSVAKAIVKHKNGKISKHGCMLVIDTALSEKSEIITIDGETAVMLTRDEIHKKDIFYIDILESQPLLICRKLQESVKRKHGEEIAFDCRNCTDESTLQLFQNGDTEGVFEFDMPKIMNDMKKVRGIDFNKLVDAIALNRLPYCYHIAEYLNGEMKAENLYKEDYFEYLTSIGFSNKEINCFSVALISHNTNELNAFMKRYIAKTTVAGTDRYVIIKNWIAFCDNYHRAFSKSHALAFAFIAYKLAYYKTHYREDFEDVNSII